MRGRGRVRGGDPLLLFGRHHAWSQALRNHLLEDFRSTAYRLSGVVPQEQGASIQLKRTVLRILIYSDEHTDDGDDDGDDDGGGGGGGDHSIKTTLEEKAFQEEAAHVSRRIGTRHLNKAHQKIGNVEAVKKDLAWWCVDLDRQVKVAARLKELKRTRKAAAIKSEALRLGTKPSEKAIADALYGKHREREAIQALGMECKIDIRRGGLMDRSLLGFAPRVEDQKNDAPFRSRSATFSEQVQTLAKVDLLIAPHGFENLALAALFLRNRSAVIEIGAPATAKSATSSSDSSESGKRSNSWWSIAEERRKQQQKQVRPLQRYEDASGGLNDHGHAAGDRSGPVNPLTKDGDFLEGESRLGSAALGGVAEALGLQHCFVHTAAASLSRPVSAAGMENSGPSDLQLTSMQLRGCLSRFLFLPRP